jgi:Uma2 family endonuclease
MIMADMELLAPEVEDEALEKMFEALASFEGKAEIINGKIVPMAATGPWPGYAGDMIFIALDQYRRRTRKGVAVADSKIFRVHLPHRQSFSPDAGYFVGSSQPMKYYDGAPTFAVEVRSSGDYGRWAEREMAQKRTDYFAAGTLVVWDVDLLSADVVRVYRSGQPVTPTIYRQGDVAEAEPAVPGWTMPVDDMLPDEWQPPPKAKPRSRH